MRKQTKSSMTSKLDKICSLIIRKQGKCCMCADEQYERLQCAHIFSRTYRNTRWDLNNLLCLCASCHFYTHRNPLIFAEFVKEYLGEYKYAQLRNYHNLVKRFTLPEMMNLYEALRKEYETND